MNTRILLLALSVVALSSCSSVYKSGQTPDDVYFSPARPQAEAYVDVRQEKEGTNYQSYDQYQDSYRDSRFLRMSIGNPYYLNAYNNYSNFDWRSNSFYDGYNYGFNSPWNNYFAWNNFYNPYSSFSYYGGGYGYGGGYYGGGYGTGGGVKYITASTTISRPVTFNPSSYSNNSYRPAGSRTNTNNSSYYNTQRYNNSNSSSNNSYYNNSGNSSSHPNTNSNSGSTNTYTPARSYTPPSSSGSSSSGSSGGGSGSVSRPGRGN